MESTYCKMYTYHIKEMLLVSNLKKYFLRFCIALILLLLTVLIAISLNYTINTKLQNHKPTRFDTDLKYILFWNNPKIKKLKSLRVKSVHEFDSGQIPFIKQNCLYKNCYISYNASLLGGDQKNFDAVIFDVHDISKFKINALNFTRSPFQKFVFRSHESSQNHPVCNPVFDNFFNWTWTYKLNSDIPHPFMSIYDVNNKLIGPKNNIVWPTTMNHTNVRDIIKHKNKAVIWIVNQCKLKKKLQDFINELRYELKGYNYTVDMFGHCGEKKCPGSQLNKCYKMADKKYYFQFVLEDSFAEDYVSDKLVKVLSYFTVPIVYGGANYTRFLPQGSYINARAFGIKKLSALIDYLIKNPVMYEYFFDWKNYYFYAVKHKSDICDLCTKLNGNINMYENYGRFRQWWNSDYNDICERMHFYELFNS
ncbi:hypothetical protein ACJJTC_010436 [Scirpophaga incertulas]